MSRRCLTLLASCLLACSLPPAAPAGLAGPSSRPAAMFVQHSHWARVTALEFSDDGSYLASAAEDWSARVWDVARGRELRFFLTAGDVVALRWAGHDRLLVRPRDGRAVIADVSAGGEVGTFGSVTTPRGLASAPGAVGAASWIAWDDRGLGLYDGLGRRAHQFGELCPDGAPTVTGLGGGGRFTAIACDDRVELWRVGDGGVEKVRTLAGVGAPDAVHVADDGATLLLVRGHTLELVHDGAATTLEQGPLGHSEVALARGTVAALGERRLSVWDGQGRLRWTLAHGEYTALALSPDGRRLALGTKHGDVELVDAASGRAPRDLGTPIRAAERVAFAGDELVVTFPTKRVTRWSLALAEVTEQQLDVGLEERATVDAGWRAPWDSLAPSTETTPVDVLAELVPTASAAAARGGDVWVGTADGEIVRVRDGEVLARGQSDGLVIRSLALSDDGALLATVSLDGAVRVWSAATAQVRGAFVEFRDGEWLVATPEGRYHGSPEAGERVGWVFDEPLEFFGFEQFSGSHRDAVAVRRRVAGGEARVLVEVSRPPRVEVLDARVDGGVARVRVRARAAADGRGRTLRRLRGFVEGRLVSEFPLSAPEAERTFEVPLVAGVNRITVLAFDDRGFSSNDAVLDLSPRAAVAGQPKLWIVAIGVGQYPHLLDRSGAPPDERRALLAGLQLDAATNDARGVARAFATLATDGVYATAHTKLLLDQEATPAAIAAALAELSAMKPGDVAIVALAGHGLKPRADGETVFLTRGARLAPDRASLDPDSAARDTVSWNEIGGAIARARGRVIVLLDACHAGHISRELVVPNDALADRLVREGRAGAIVFAAAKGRQPSFEPRAARAVDLADFAAVTPAPQASDDGGHGFFTGAVIASLRSSITDRDGDGAVQASELIAEVTQRVGVASHGLQTPWVARRDLFGDFTVARAVVGEAGVVREGASVGVAPLPASDGSPAAELARAQAEVERYFGVDAYRARYAEVGEGWLDVYLEDRTRVRDIVARLSAWSSPPEVGVAALLTVAELFDRLADLTAELEPQPTQLMSARESQLLAQLEASGRPELVERGAAILAARAAQWRDLRARDQAAYVAARGPAYAAALRAASAAGLTSPELERARSRQTELLAP